MTKSIDLKIEKIGILKSQRHFFICVGDACSGGREDVWEHVKKRSKELADRGIFISRTRTTCLRICQQGPIGVVYPEGIWYAGLDIPNCDRVISEHLEKGEIVKDLVIASCPL